MSLKNILPKNSDLTETEIDRMIQNWEEQIEKAINDAEALYADAKQKALELSDKISDAVVLLAS